MTELFTLIGFIFGVAFVVVLTIVGIGFLALRRDDDE